MSWRLAWVRQSVQGQSGLYSKNIFRNQRKGRGRKEGRKKRRRKEGRKS